MLVETGQRNPFPERLVGGVLRGRDTNDAQAFAHASSKGAYNQRGRGAGSEAYAHAVGDLRGGRFSGCGFQLILGRGAYYLLGLGGRRVILKMFVQVLVIFALLFAPRDGGAFVRAAEAGLPGGFRAHRTEGDQLLQMLFVARGALRGGG